MTCKQQYKLRSSKNGAASVRPPDIPREFLEMELSQVAPCCKSFSLYACWIDANKGPHHDLTGQLPLDCCMQKEELDDTCSTSDPVGMADGPIHQGVDGHPEGSGYTNRLPDAPGSKQSTVQHICEPCTLGPGKSCDQWTEHASPSSEPTWEAVVLLERGRRMATVIEAWLLKVYK